MRCFFISTYYVCGDHISRQIKINDTTSWSGYVLQRHEDLMVPPRFKFQDTAEPSLYGHSVERRHPFTAKNSLRFFLIYKCMHLTALSCSVISFLQKVALQRRFYCIISVNHRFCNCTPDVTCARAIFVGVHILEHFTNRPNK